MAVFKALAFLLLISSANADPCENVNCGIFKRHGVCREGTCDCLYPWTGDDCGIQLGCTDPCENVNCNECQECVGGSCQADSAKVGESCDDGLQSTAGDICYGHNGGFCFGQSTTTTSTTDAPDLCENVNCNECQLCVGGSCQADLAKVGQPCDDGDSTTGGDVCWEARHGGMCLGWSTTTTTTSSTTSTTDAPDPCEDLNCNECQECVGGSVGFSCKADLAKVGQPCNDGDSRTGFDVCNLFGNYAYCLGRTTTSTTDAPGGR